VRAGIIAALISRARHAPEYTRRHQALCGHSGTMITTSALSRSTLSKIWSIMWKLGTMNDTPVRQLCAIASTASELVESKSELKRAAVALCAAAKRSTSHVPKVRLTYASQSGRRPNSNLSMNLLRSSASCTKSRRTHRKRTSASSAAPENLSRNHCYDLH